MNNLQCPARAVVVATSAVGPDVGEWCSRLWAERVVCVYSAGPVGSLLAKALDVPHRVADLPRELPDLADLHRGETILLVVDDHALDVIPGRGEVRTLLDDGEGWVAAPG